MSEWISVKVRHVPPMETVLLCINGKVLPGWNEAIQPDEDPCYCTWEDMDLHAKVTHWTELPEAPK